MSSKNKQIGIIGEQILIAEFIKHGINVLLQIGDNSPYDIAVIPSHHFCLPALAQ